LVAHVAKINGRKVLLGYIFLPNAEEVRSGGGQGERERERERAIEIKVYYTDEKIGMTTVVTDGPHLLASRIDSKKP
jgi:hypothetical protein